MKHALAVAVMNGWTFALSAEVENGDMTVEQAAQIARFAAAVSGEYLKGTRLRGKTLTDFREDGESYERFLTSQKINLQKLGD